MPVFEYRTKTASGRKLVDTIVAETPRDARDKLRTRGVVIDSISLVASIGPAAQESSERQGNWFVSASNAIQWRPYFGGQVSWFTREMATLLRVGTPMVDAFDLVIQQSKGPFRNVLQDIREQITGGSSLGAAVRRHPYTFDPVLCEMVSVGEQSGALQSVLKQGAEFRERRDKLKDRVVSAMLYPSLVFLLSILVTVFLMTVVSPTLINSLQELQRELPLPTRILKACSDFLLQWGIVLGVSLLIALVAGMIAMKRTTVRRWRDRWLLRVPVLGTLIIKQNCSRLCMVTGTLLRSGVELVRALEIAQGAVLNSAMADVIAEARKRLASGADLGSAMKADGIFPLALVQVFALGQNTGELEELLFQIAEDYDHQVGMLADRLTTIMEPILIVGLSIIVGFILMATLLPILETGNALSDS
jgi:type II secretory pathway component PulF